MAGVTATTSTRLVLMLFLPFLGLTTTSQAAVTVVDLTYDFGDETLYWPGNPTFQFNILARGNSSGGFWYESNSFFTAEHGGTHVDAPAHFAKDRWRVEDIPASHLVGLAAVIDVSAKVEADPDYLLSIQDIEDWERAYGQLPPKSMVIMNSGWGSRYPNPSKVFNTAQPTDSSTFSFPGIDPNLATYLITQRDIIAMGVDTPSLDRGISRTYDTHINLFKANIIGLENLANLHRLPSHGAVIFTGLVKLVDGSGGPARILALVGDGLSEVFGGAATAGGGDRCTVAAVLVVWVVLLSGWLGRQVGLVM